jgi:hypothetical protein
MKNLKFTILVFFICYLFLGFTHKEHRFIGCWTSKSIQKWEPNLHPNVFDYDTIYIKRNKSFTWIKHYNGLIPIIESGNWNIIQDTLFLLSTKESFYFHSSGNKSKLNKPFNIVNKVTKLIIENKGHSEEYFGFIANNQYHKFEKIK